MSANTDILICPITQQIMTDPVTDRDGNTYEKSAIMQWLNMHNTSPITRRYMTSDELVPNRIVRDLLEAATGQEASLQTNMMAYPITRTAENITGLIVLDASGSMSTLCDTPGESTGMTRIDLTKYSARIIIESLKPGDCMGIITFNDKAHELASMRQINSDHDKTQLISALDRYTASGSTNIYDAVITAITTLANAIQPGEPASIFLLTDGEPTINPPDIRNQGITKSTIDAIMRGIHHSQRITDTVSVSDILQNVTINTFGYGYNLLPDLMVDITQLGNAKQGIFGFVPDATMLGTVLINAMSRTRYPDLVALDPCDITLCNQAAELLAEICKNSDYNMVNHQTLQNLNTFIAILDSTPNNTVFANALLMDFKENPDPNLGQVNKACMPEHYSKWGKYYLMALTTAFQTRACLNFKDNALQCFKTPAVEQEQGRLSDIFLTSTPPTPTGNNYRSHGHNNGPVNMSSYLNSSGGCFGPQTNIALHDGNTKLISELKAGDDVETDSGHSIVECIIELPYTGDIYKIDDGLFLTPWHPFTTISGDSYFPAKYPGATKFSYTGIVYNIVLATRACICCAYVTEIGKMEITCVAATLGHYAHYYIPEFNHPYYGSDIVINELKATGMYESGCISVKSYDVQRDLTTGLVTGITYQVE